jgi:Zn-dependent protease
MPSENPAETQANQPNNNTIPNSVYTSEEVLDEIAKQQSGTGSWTKNLFILLISLLIFFRLGLFKNNITDLMVIIAVLLVHELGHFIGMRIFGYKNIQMFFIPFFGAAVTGQSRNVPPYKKALVTLLGPVPGMLFGIFLLIVHLKTKTPVYCQLSQMFLLINGLYLLPFFPLDGGRFLHEVLFSRNRFLELCWQLLASLALIAGGLLLNSWLLALLGVFGLISARVTFKVARIANELKPLFLTINKNHATTAANEPGDATRIPSLIAQKIIEKVHQDISPKLNVKTVATYTKDIWERVHLPRLHVPQMLGLLAVYILCLVFSLLSLIGVALISLPGQKTIFEKRIVKYEKSDGEVAQKEQIYMFGKLKSETDVAGVPLLYHGRTVKYHYNGSVYSEGSWLYGKRDGEWKYYDEQGSMTRIIVFDKGKFVVCKERDGIRWVEKELKDLPVSVRKNLNKHAEGTPVGPK